MLRQEHFSKFKDGMGYSVRLSKKISKYINLHTINKYTSKPSKRIWCISPMQTLIENIISCLCKSIATCRAVECNSALHRVGYLYMFAANIRLLLTISYVTWKHQWGTDTSTDYRNIAFNWPKRQGVYSEVEEMAAGSGRSNCSVTDECLSLLWVEVT